MWRLLNCKVQRTQTETRKTWCHCSLGDTSNESSKGSCLIFAPNLVHSVHYWWFILWSNSWSTVSTQRPGQPIDLHGSTEPLIMSCQLKALSMFRQAIRQLANQSNNRPIGFWFKYEVIQPYSTNNTTSVHCSSSLNRPANKRHWMSWKLIFRLCLHAHVHSLSYLKLQCRQDGVFASQWKKFGLQDIPMTFRWHSNGIPADYSSQEMKHPGPQPLEVLLICRRFWLTWRQGSPTDATMWKASCQQHIGDHNLWWIIMIYLYDWYDYILRFCCSLSKPF